MPKPNGAIESADSAEQFDHFQCRVCHAHATGFHFNAQSCQACCAFFRRAISLDRQYLCHRRERNGAGGHKLANNNNNNLAPPCNIHYTEKILCRACRLQKCMAIGMDRAAVQMPKREKQQAEGRSYFTKSGLLRNKRFARGAFELLEQKVPTPSASAASSAPSSVSISPNEPSTSSSSAATFNGQSQGPFSVPPAASSPRNLIAANSPLLQPTKSPNQQQDPSTSQPSPVPPLRLPNTPNWDLLSLLVEEEMRIAERRRILFCERPVAILLGQNKNCPFTKEDIKPLHFHEFRRSIRTHILLVYEWLRVWPAYDELRMEDRITLLRKCVLYHTVLDPCFLTIQIGDLGKFVLPNGGYVSTKYPPALDEGWADEPEITHQTKIKIYWPLLVPLMSGCVAPMLRLGLKFEEFVALKAIVSLQMTLPDISFSGRALVSRELECMCRALYKFYTIQPEFSGDEFLRAERFGNLLLLLTPIIDTANTFVESHHIVQFFDLWQMDSLMLQFLQNKSC